MDEEERGKKIEKDEKRKKKNEELERELRIAGVERSDKKKLRIK